MTSERAMMRGLLMVAVFAVAGCAPGETRTDTFPPQPPTIHHEQTTAQAKAILDAVGARDDQIASSLPTRSVRVSHYPDGREQITEASHFLQHSLPDGLRLWVYGQRCVGPGEDPNGPCDVKTIALLDSSELRDRKQWWPVGIERIVFRDGLSFPEGLPDSAVYRNQPREEALERLTKTPWTLTSVEKWEEMRWLDGRKRRIHGPERRYGWKGAHLRVCLRHVGGRQRVWKVIYAEPSEWTEDRDRLPRLTSVTYEVFVPERFIDGGKPLTVAETVSRYRNQ